METCFLLSSLCGLVGSVVGIAIGMIHVEQSIAKECQENKSFALGGTLYYVSRTLGGTRDE